MTTKRQKKKFVNELIDNVRKEILAQVGNMPKDWDGVELRWYIRDRFNLVVFGGFHDKRSKKYQDYENHVLVNNMI